MDFSLFAVQPARHLTILPIGGRRRRQIGLPAPNSCSACPENINGGKLAHFTHDLLILFFALAGGLTLSGISANLYRILAGKPASRPGIALHYAVMAIAGPSVLLNNATQSFRKEGCSTLAYAIAVLTASYWSFALGLLVLSATAKI
jgi:hypothetical protein